MKSQAARLTLLTTATLVFLCSVNAFAQRGASLRGQVTDQLGAVIVSANVTLTDANGNVTDLKFISVPPILRQAAMDAVRQWKYDPARLNGRHVAIHLGLTVRFRFE